MCTVTYIPSEGDIYLTSNRDERPGRHPALFPHRSGSGKEQLLYPKDSEAGGSWIALKNTGDAAVLLNGAFVKHRRTAAYRLSRGLVFLEIARAVDPPEAFGAIDLAGIEPFTLILFAGGLLFECRWDGLDRHVARLCPGSPHIWSSSTLYDEKAAKAREQRFGDWRQVTPRVDGNSILDFHRSEERIGDDREGSLAGQGKIATVSITSIRIADGGSSMRYIDLRTGRRNEAGFTVATEKPERALDYLKRLLTRVASWEYWPFAILYLPVFFYWAWLSVKARSFFFFSTANPSITNAGFLMESKRQIYDLMPQGSYPGTVYCPKGRPVIAIRQSLQERQLKFPLIAKPDIGQRGMQVSLLKDECALYLYSARSKVDFLLQEYIDYPHEAGIFYYRRPGEPKGHISGIVGKELLAVRGDGQSTVEMLLRMNGRYALQIPALRAAYGHFLEQIPARGEEHLLVPYGNHSRGAKFLDWTDRVTPALETMIDAVCRRVPGFYFGRLDIRFASWEELCAGRKFSVIELNGAGSEPAHIYDPGHSIFFAWKEIIRHLRLLFDISRANARREGLTPMSMREGLNMLRDYAKHEKLIS
ncbi:MAG: NRDE family protein [Bacteroidota bacterium]|nr:NRDE family protein [Bacteroidota bacterium]